MVSIEIKSDYDEAVKELQENEDLSFVVIDYDDEAFAVYRDTTLQEAIIALHPSAVMANEFLNVIDQIKGSIALLIRNMEHEGGEELWGDFLDEVKSVL